MSDDPIEAIRRLYGGPHHAAPPGSVVAHIRTLLAALDAALARAEAAERERDEARRAAIEEALRAMRCRRDLTLGDPNDRLVAGVLMDEVRALLVPRPGEP